MSKDYRVGMLESLQSDHRRRMRDADFGMIRQTLYLLFWVAAITFYVGAMYE